MTASGRVMDWILFEVGFSPRHGRVGEERQRTGERELGDAERKGKGCGVGDLGGGGGRRGVNS